MKKGRKYGTATIIGDSRRKAADVEPIVSSKPLAARKDAAFNSPVCITVVSYRTRLADADGISAKAAIDGLVHAGVIEDDGPKFVKEVRYKQIKVKNKEEERFELLIEVVE